MRNIHQSQNIGLTVYEDIRKTFLPVLQKQSKYRTS